MMRRFFYFIVVLWVDFPNGTKMNNLRDPTRIVLAMAKLGSTELMKMELLKGDSLEGYAHTPVSNPK